MLDHLTGEMRDSVTSRDLVDSSPLLQEQPIGFAQCPLPLGLPQPDILTQAGPSNFSTLGSIPNGRTAGNYSLLDGPSEAATAPARTQSSGLLILEAQPPGQLQSRGWKPPPLCLTSARINAASAILRRLSNFPHLAGISHMPRLCNAYPGHELTPLIKGCIVVQIWIAVLGSWDQVAIWALFYRPQ